jgi:AcrR family transcriptional regulator
MVTQAERKDETRARLIAAATTVFAERGVEGASVDAIAEEAGRTSGALYAHFGSKEGLLIELLESWRNEVSVAISVDLSTARTVDERLLALWHNFARAEDGVRQWVQLEHELWRWVTRAQHDEMRALVAERYRASGDKMTAMLGEWAGERLIPEPDADAGTAMMGLMIGLEMQHRLDPETVTDEVALSSLRALLGLRGVRSTGGRSSRLRT